MESNWHYTPYMIPLFITLIIVMSLAFYGWQRRTTPGIIPFVLLMLALGAWSAGYLLELGSLELTGKIFWGKVQYLGIVAVPLIWLIFALEFTSNGKWLTRRNITLLAIPLMTTLLLVWSTEYHGLMWREMSLNISGPFSVLEISYGPWFWVHVTYTYLLMLLGTLLLINMWMRSPHLYRLQSGMLLFGSLAPWIGNGLYIFRLGPVPDLDITPFVFALTGLALAWNLFRFRLFDIAPVARQAIIDEMADGVIVLDLQNRIVDLNPAAQLLINSDSTSAIGKTGTQLLSSWPHLITHYRNITEGQTEVILSRPGEGTRYFDMRISPLYDRRKSLTGRLIVLRDISERKQTEHALAQAHEQALIASRLKSELLARVSHELRTPLGVVMGFAELLEMGIYGPLNAEQKEATEQVIENTQYLTKLVNELLDQSRLEAGKLHLEFSDFKAADLAKEVQSKMGVLAQAKNLVLTAEIAQDMPEILSGDRYRLSQILLNLVHNAIKFTETGTIQVRIQRASPTCWMIKVSDTGPGIPAEVHSHIFEPFSQMDETITRKYGGTGLGLSIVKQLTHLMGGQITLESEVGRGSTFTVRFPLDLTQKELANS